MITKDIPGISQRTGIYQGYPWYMQKHEKLSTGIRFQMSSLQAWHVNNLNLNQDPIVLIQAVKFVNHS